MIKAFSFSLSPPGGIFCGRCANQKKKEGKKKKGKGKRLRNGRRGSNKRKTKETMERRISQMLASLLLKA
jgi:hypothetical protein